MTELTRKLALENLKVELKENGYEVTEKALESCFDSVRRKYRLPSWRHMPMEQKEETLSTVRNKQIDSVENDMHRQKNWILDGEGYTTRKLYRLVRKDSRIHGSEIQLPTEQNFGRSLTRLRASESKVIDRNSVIASYQSLVDSTIHFAKTALCNIYQLEFTQGPHEGKRYVGITQCSVSERLRWHFINATRPESSERNPKNRLYEALRDSLIFSGNSESWLNISVLESDVKPATAKIIESYYCEIVAAEIGNEKVLNVATPGSSGGRSGTRTVAYKKKSIT
jgi:hypothetical protein